MGIVDGALVDGATDNRGRWGRGGVAVEDRDWGNGGGIEVGSYLSLQGAAGSRDELVGWEGGCGKSGSVQGFAHVEGEVWMGVPTGWVAKQAVGERRKGEGRQR